MKRFPPELSELTLPFYTSGWPPARAFFKHGERKGISLQVCRLPCEFSYMRGRGAQPSGFTT